MERLAVPSTLELAPIYPMLFIASNKTIVKRLVLLGSYGLKVLEGEITIFGASLRPGDPVQWVHAPRCHALPVIRTAAATTLELHLHPSANGLRALEQLSPVFGKLWNDEKGQNRFSRPGSNSQHEDTFQIVSHFPKLDLIFVSSFSI